MNENALSKKQVASSSVGPRTRRKSIKWVGPLEVRGRRQVGLLGLGPLG